MSDPGKIKITVGPGFVNQFDEIQKIVGGKTNAVIAEEMKELMSKSVAELVAGDDPEEVQTVSVRGRELVLPPSGHQRGITVLFACLYALENDAVDKILSGLELKAQFKVGKAIGTQPLVPTNSVAPAPPQKSQQDQDVPEEQPKRNIILGKPKLVEKPFAMVLVSDQSGPLAVGYIEVWRSKAGHHMVRILPSAETVEVSEDRLTPIDGDVQLASATAAVASRK